METQNVINPSDPIINIGDYVIIQRQKYTKLHKIGDVFRVMLGNEQLELHNIIGQKYGTTFKMIPKDDGKMKRLNTLEVCSETEIKNLRDKLGIQESGTDNRNIIDDGESQTLNAQDISKLRDECSGSSKILEKIVENSKTFNSKTEYAQEKYLKKKERKYFEFVQIRQPTIRLLTEIYYRQQPDKIMGIRMDTLSQILSYSSICSYGNYLVYESGTSGLIPAAFLNAIGSKTEAQLVHMHPGNICQKQALLALNFPEEQMKRCISVNVYSVLREYYQKYECESTLSSSSSLSTNENDDKIQSVDESNKNQIETEIEKQNENDVDELEEEQTPCKKLKLSDETNDNKLSLNELNNDTIMVTEKSINDNGNNLPQWQLENKRACQLMKNKFDGLVIIAREHPSSIVKALLPFLNSSRPIIIYNLSKEILMELYVELKSTAKITALHLRSNWLRMYQILPNRTHPEVQMNGNSGYLLCGYTVG